MKILIAEDDPVSSRVLSVILGKWGHEVVVTRDGLEAWAVLSGPGAPPLAILDWMMPGMDGVEVCRQVRRAASATYLILLTAKSLKEDLLAGMEAGADDFLTKPFDRDELRARLQAGERIVRLQQCLAERVRELEEAVERRERAETALREMALTDDLTGLYNRRGFFTLAEHHLKVARRAKRTPVIVYADMDGLKRINDTYGHQEGSQAIANLASVLRQTFRDSDIIARLGGDEFAILAADASGADASDGLDTIRERLCENLQRYNEQAAHAYTLSASLGLTRADTRLSVEELIAQADEAMYQEKRLLKHNASQLVPA